MKSSICFPFSDLPVEIALIIFKYAAKPTFSQKEEYNDQNPYANALSLCLVSRLVRHTVLPKLLDTVLLPTRRNIEAFASALELQKKYTEDKSHLAFDYIPAVQRLWISRSTGDWMFDSPKLSIITLLPVLLAVPTLAIECSYLASIVISLKGDHRPSHFSGKTLILTVKHQAGFHEYFKFIQKSVLFASISHLTYLIELNLDSNTFFNISKGFKSPDFPLGSWMSQIPWDCMNSLETFSVVYPHPSLGLLETSLPFDQGVDLHVERLTVSAPLYKQNPGSFSWVTAPFPRTPPGEESAPTKGLSFKVTHGQGHFRRFGFTWEKVWACGLAD
ncbi:hypothetical protein CY34DRAFT_813195 [Suillus luteus UH-Slu-Lm8-n1]|uniref:F-box domain-containing protein n=1 Tax=Suillus luteus UH-Slu-Lm8-n1 TaxID=930992 RepID=A0A0C9ZXC7_9AGAM|nr:hypothetical protein CY34DRAFT_813195 [Suillus luteus UH-Slu-Lm8-n1]